MAEQDGPSDDELIERVLAGEKDAFRGLLLAYQNMVFALIMRQVGNRSFASELTQETFIRAYTKLGTFRRESRFSTWLVRIALNVTNNFVSSRSFREEQRKVTIDDVKENIHDDAAGEKKLAADREHHLTQLRRAIANLPRHFREVIALVGLEGKSYEQAASILEIPVGTVRSRLNTARNLLRAAMSEL